VEIDLSLFIASDNKYSQKPIRLGKGEFSKTISTHEKGMSVFLYRGIQRYEFELPLRLTVHERQPQYQQSMTPYCLLIETSWKTRLSNQTHLEVRLSTFQVFRNCHQSVKSLGRSVTCIISIQSEQKVTRRIFRCFEILLSNQHAEENRRVE